MTTTKEAAGLVERLERLAGMTDDDPYTDGAGEVIREAAQEIRTLLAQVEEVRRERDLLDKAHQEELARRVENGARALTAEARATEAEAGIAEAVKAEREALCGLLYKRLPPEYCDPIISEVRAFVEKHKESQT